MAMRLTCENVRIIEQRFLDDIELWGVDDKVTAEKTLTYIAGIHDMANAVMEAIKSLGGN